MKANYSYSQSSPLFFWLLVVHLLPWDVAVALALHPQSSILTSKSGLPISSYGLGGAARSTQPSSLPSLYYNEISKKSTRTVAPFYFYYNPHRYPDFMSGIKDICETKPREDIFVMSGGTDLSTSGLEQRLSDCLDYCGGDYLDAFVLEYVCPPDIRNEVPGPELASALKHMQTWIQNGFVRYIGISTHSHQVGSVLASCQDIDLLMLRYGMSHCLAAEGLSFPAARENSKPVVAFTSTRWNSLQNGGNGPTSADCLSFVFGSSTEEKEDSSTTPTTPVVAVLHSARDEDEILESLGGLRILTAEEETKWRAYGRTFEEANADSFDEYPEERGI